MKLLRYGPKGREKPGLLDKDGGVRDLSGILPDIDKTTLGSGEVARLKKVDPESLPKVPRRPRIGAPIAAVGNFIAIGLNYVDHAKETGAAIPTAPRPFYQAAGSPPPPHIVP